MKHNEKIIIYAYGQLSAIKNLLYYYYYNISSVDWNQLFSTLPTDIYMETFFDKLAEICSSSAPLLKKTAKEFQVFIRSVKL